MDEFGIIAKYFAPLAGEGAFGLKDDAAVLPARPGHELVVTTDTISQGTDFFAFDPADTVALLSALEHREAAPVIATLYDHPDHFVRWSAVRRVIELDPALGTPLVYRALTDPHPHIRRAAQRSVERYEASRSKEITCERKSHGADA